VIEGIIHRMLDALSNGDKKFGFIHQKFLPRWIVFLLDVFIISFSLLITHAILINLGISFYDTFPIWVQYSLLLVLNATFFVLYRTFSGIIRHSTFTDITKLFLASTTTLLCVAAINYSFYFVTFDKVFLMPGVVFYAFLSFSLLLLFRIFIKSFYGFIKSNEVPSGYKKRLVVYGIDDQSIAIAEVLKSDVTNPFELVGFVSKNKNSKNIRIFNKPVFSLQTLLCGVFENKRIHGVLLIDGSLSIKHKNKLVNECLKANLQIFNVPKVEKLKKNQTLNNQIKAVDIEDLLGRDEIYLDDEVISTMLEGKNILVTGGAGSIGSEIVRQIIPYNPSVIVILDQSETQLHNLELELKQNFPNCNIVTELADIRNLYRLNFIFEQYQFDIVYHAAAYKHVPMIENNPFEAVYVNILGTINIVKLSIAHNIERFVMVSTDKAVNPTNVMGASKRAAEIYIQSIQNEPAVNTKFIITRFGNVLGSNGSVIPLFKRQIAAGGPVNITHPDIIRYFMTISEATQLVLQAGTMGDGGEIFVFDMGKPVKIIDLAKKLIRLSGLVPDEDIKIKVTGLRPGEKLYEELLADSSINIPTHHPKILAARETALPFKQIEKIYQNLANVAYSGTENELVSILKEIVVEYKSENSKFVFLDK
jgi:FlaA1/EpsC-like NDP-sugar epimerase